MKPPTFQRRPPSPPPIIPTPQLLVIITMSNPSYYPGLESMCRGELSAIIAWLMSKCL